jgi:hypothetical protein
MHPQFSISIHSRIGGEYLVNLAGQVRPGVLIKDLGFGWHVSDRILQGAGGALTGVAGKSAAGVVSKITAAKFVRPPPSFFLPLRNSARSRRSAPGASRP